MANDDNAVNKLIPHLFRQEYAKMTAVLSRYFGWQYIDVAEDIASEAFLKATEHWLQQGIPANPSAWLYTVARNKAKDYLKRNQLFETKIKAAIKATKTTTDIEFEFNDTIIADSQLSMIFVVCDPINPAPAQICLALQILCGFSVEEIANAFLCHAETIKKRLQRARANLRTEGFQLRSLSQAEISTRLDVVLKTIYLLFNEGYFSQREKELVRKDLCSEAIRLTLLLAENNLTNIPRVHALLALLCYQSSRLNARTNDAGEAILYDDQDRDLWDPFLIEKGNYYFWKAFGSQELSTYHLEAGIAYWHTTRTGDKWPQILQLYNQLLMMEYSPVSAINRTFAFAKVYGNEQAIKEAAKLDLKENSYYHGLMGFLYTGIDAALAVTHYQQALTLTSSLVEKKVFKDKIAQLDSNVQ